FKQHDNYVIVGHVDTDGITSAAILSKALQREGKKVKTTALKQLYTEDIQKLDKLGQHVILTDFGSAKIKALKEGITGTFYVIDHHQPAEESYEWNINPLDYGVDGSKDICSAGIAYLIAKNLNEKNKDLSGLAIVGALGDMQDYNTKELVGINQNIILPDALESGQISTRKDLKLYGRISRPLLKMLLLASDPIIPGITSNVSNCLQALREANVQTKNGDTYRTYDDLSEDERKRLISVLLMKLIQANEPPWVLDKLVGTIYTLENEDPKSPLRDAREFSTVLNSCGRHGEVETGVQIAMGDRTGYYEKGLLLLKNHQRTIAQGIEAVIESGIHEEDNFYWFDARGIIPGTVVGIVAGMLYGGGSIGSDKSVIALSLDSDENVKISGRTTQKLIHKGINIGKAMTAACKQLGGIAEGGGHKPAGGCRLAPGQETEFLRVINTVFGEQLNRPKETL
ncbi:MAG: DHH family phosphoesterase, partial [Candidatus Diapherotrites archaeon]|nr:DHH family phosphoesterase [Candidatus Diapherotrites archaeon]